MKGPGPESDSVRFRYYPEAETMFLDGAPLIKGIPAKLLLAMLKAHLETGRKIFFLPELRKDPSLQGRRPNLEARMERLAERLRERTAAVRLLSQRGCRILECGRRIDLEEGPN